MNKTPHNTLRYAAALEAQGVLLPAMVAQQSAPMTISAAVGHPPSSGSNSRLISEVMNLTQEERAELMHVLKGDGSAVKVEEGGPVRRFTKEDNIVIDLTE